MIRAVVFLVLVFAAINYAADTQVVRDWQDRQVAGHVCNIAVTSGDDALITNKCKEK